MPIGNLQNKVSSSDVAKVKEKRNPPEYEAGFEPESSSEDFGNIFDDISFDDFDTPSSSQSENKEKVSVWDIFGSKPNNVNQQQQGSSLNVFDSTNSFGTFGQPAFGQSIFGQPQQTQPKGPDTLDKVMDAAGTSMKSIGKILLDLIKSVKNRTADDWGLYSRNVIITSGVVAGAGIVLGIIGLAGNIKPIKFGGLPLQLFISAMLLFGTGLIGISIAALRIASNSSYLKESIEQIPDVTINNSDADDIEIVDDEEESLDDILGDLFSSDDFTNEEVNTFEPKEEIKPNDNTVDYKEILDNVQAKVPMLSREVLFNTFKPFFPTNTTGFAERRRIPEDSDEFATIETLCLKALAAAAKTDLENIESQLEEAIETYFCYELRMKRVKGLNKLDDIAREMVAYFRESSTDASVTSQVDIEGDMYKIIINKGIQAIVTFGDIFTLPKVVDFYKNTKNILPCVAGITEGGEPVLVDAKYYDTVLIAGKQRSGKSWYLLSLLISMMLFNTPEDVVFLIIDPKESNLFKTLALMPHVCGLHSDTHVLEILDDVIRKEGARRKKLLADHQCDTIWALRNRAGIKLPVLYIVIDEVMTVLANLKDKEKEFFDLINVIISQLPSQGIRIMMVPHRAQGVVDKTTRSLITYTAAIRAENEVVLETLGIKKWDRPLINPGDVALKLQDVGKEFYVKGVAVTLEDEDNTEFIRNVAKAYYKMGVEVPDMRTLGSGYNGDENYIREALRLEADSTKVQFDIDDVSDINDSDINIDDLI